MNYPLTASALLVSLLGACATPSVVTPTLVDARAAVRSAELDPAVQAQAPLELKKATDTLSRANALQASGEAAPEIDSLAHIARQQARTAQALAHAKTSESAVAGAVVERERARADLRTLEANRAKDQAGTAQAQASAARQQTAEAVAAAAEAQSQANQLQQRLNDLQAKQTERGLLVTLGDVLFEFNRAEVKPTAQSSLRKLADFLQQYPNRKILIEGHTDNTGSAAYNQGLSRRRADAVQRALTGMGVAPDRVASIGYGEEYPISDNSSDTNRALNRRVEVYIADNDQPVRPRR